MEPVVGNSGLHARFLASSARDVAAWIRERECLGLVCSNTETFALAVLRIMQLGAISAARRLRTGSSASTHRQIANAHVARSGRIGWGRTATFWG